MDDEKTPYGINPDDPEGIKRLKNIANRDRRTGKAVLSDFTSMSVGQRIGACCACFGCGWLVALVGLVGIGMFL